MQFSQRKFAVTSVIKIYSKVLECIKTMIICIFTYLLNKRNFCLKPTFFREITILFLLILLFSGSRFLKKFISFSGLRFRYQRLPNRKKLILPLGNFFKTWKDMIIGTASKLLFESFTTFQSGKIML